MSVINSKCKKCGEGCSGRKQFCSDHCKYWYHQIKKDNERGLAPARKRNASFFFMVVGSEWARQRGQGRRCGGMIRGAMAARVNVTIEIVAECTPENIRPISPEYLVMNLNTCAWATKLASSGRKYLTALAWSSEARINKKRPCITARPFLLGFYEYPAELFCRDIIPIWQ